MIYYSNVCEGKPCKNKTSFFWSNITLSNSFRAIENEYGTNKNNAGNVFPSAFNYEARLLTFQELKKQY